MISRTKVNKIIDEAEKDFRKCWAFLKKMKGAKTTPFTANELLTFQPKLAETIFKLSKLYQDLHQEKRYFIKRKSLINRDWFNKRLKLIKDYQEAISTTIAIGKALGDAYAWFFYHKERDALVEHLKHERIFYPPPGIGGIGELEFIRRVQRINGHLVLYHGITNLLRLGDMSFIDIKTLELAGIAELKTNQTGPEAIAIDFLLKGKGERLRKALDEQVTKSERAVPTSEAEEYNLPPHINQKLKEQLQQIEKSFEKNPSDKNLRINVQSNLDRFENLFEDITTRRTAFKKVGRGQVLARIKLTGRTLSSRLIVNSVKDWSKELAGIEELVLEIMTSNRTDNRLYVEPIHNPSPKHRIIPGVIPLFWWSLPIDIVEHILFYNVLLVSTYNPAHFIQGLRALGCEVKITDKGYEVKKKIGDQFVALEGVPYFLGLIAGQLYPEESVLEMIDKVLKIIEEEKFEPFTRIDIRFFEMFH